jgi:hypothetical protein
MLAISEKKMAAWSRMDDRTVQAFYPGIDYNGKGAKSKEKLTLFSKIDQDIYN